MKTSAILTALLDRLWVTYRDRVAHAHRYAELVEARGGRVINDHIAFRTFHAKVGDVPSGIEAVSRLITPFGYEQAGTYAFTDKHLRAHHYQHPDPALPKIFISQLEVAELPAESQAMIDRTVSQAIDILTDDDVQMLADADGLSDEQSHELIGRLYRVFTQRPWPAPPASDVIALDEVSQYAAWTLLHGYNVNHFTAYINEQNVPDWPDIDTTVTALREAGVPMKPTVEGESGSKLRQSATQAVEEVMDVLDEKGNPAKLRWTYAYYELAERGDVGDEAGQLTRFQGFLGAQATHLFDMTQRQS